MIVTDYTPKYHCDYEKDFNDANLSVPDLIARNGEERFHSFVLPNTTNNLGHTVRSSCEQYKLNSDVIAHLQENNFELPESRIDDNTTIFECESYTFLKEDGENSAVIEMNLVCENSWGRKFVPSALMLGMGIGTLIGGFISDRFGRKVTLITFTLTQIVSTGVVGLSNSPWAYIISMFLAGTSNLVNYGAGSVLGYELVRKEYRNFVYLGMVGFYNIGCFLFVALAYFIRDWRWFCFVSFGCGLPYISYIWLLDESPQWLIVAGKKDKAEKVLRKIALCNGLEYDDKAFAEEEKKANTKSYDSTSVLNVWKQFVQHPVLIRTFAICIFSWIMTNMLYFAMTLSTNELPGNRFANAAIAVCFDQVGSIICWILNEYLDRRKIFMVSSAITGVCLAVIPYLAEVSEIAMNVASFTVRLGAAAMFYMIYIVTPEVFPTLLRNSTMSICSSTSRFVSMLLPFIMYSDSAKGTSLFTACLVFVSCLSYTWIPNTFNQPLPESIQDCLNQKRGGLLCSSNEDDVMTTSEKVREQSQSLVQQL